MKKRKDTKIATVYSKFLTPKDKNLAVGSGMNQERSATTEGTYQVQIDGKESEPIGMHEDSMAIKKKLMKLGLTKDIQVEVMGAPEGSQHVMIMFNNQSTTMNQNGLTIKDMDKKSWLGLKREQEASNNMVYMPLAQDQLTIRTKYP